MSKTSARRSGGSDRFFEHLLNILQVYFIPDGLPDLSVVRTGILFNNIL
ncbi:MAG: hypothetical protein V1871_02945 [Planctomycetota bacterium]